MINEAKLDFWVKNNLDVLLTGEHGVGKTAMVIGAFKRAGLKYRYFSAATMDPWVDFIGVPKEKIDDAGNSYLELIRPKDFSTDEVEAIFFDEFNRAPAKIRNAVLEFIQFKSINGKRFEKLRMIWAAINPYDEEGTYDVEEIDPAQLDRFTVQVAVPYKVDSAWFKTNYGDKGIVAATWWNALSAANQKKISPRRLEGGLKMHLMGGDVRDVFPKSINVSDFVNQLNQGSYAKKLEDLFSAGDKEQARNAFQNENFYNATIDKVVDNTDQLLFFYDVLPDEKLSSLVSANKKARNKLLDNVTASETLKTILEQFIVSRNMKAPIHSQFTGWIKKNYANTSSVARDELNTEINASLKGNTTADGKIAMLNKIASDPTPWFKQPKISENICRFICNTLATSQTSTLKFKRLDYPDTPADYINKIIYLIGPTEFRNYLTKHRGQLSNKFRGRAEKINEFMANEFAVSNVEIKLSDLRRELTGNADTVTPSMPNVVEMPRAPKPKGKRGRPRKNPLLPSVNKILGGVYNTPIPISKPAQSISDLLNDALRKKKVTPLKDMKEWDDVSKEIEDDTYDETGT